MLAVVHDRHRTLRAGGPVEGRPVRRVVLHRGPDHQDLLPAELPGGAAEGREHALLPERGRGPAGRVPRLQAVPPGRQPGLAGVERPGRPGRPGDAADRATASSTATACRALPRGSATASARCSASCSPSSAPGPLALARAQRAQTARLLVETSALPMAEVAFAAGFASVRTLQRDRPRGVRARPRPSCAAGPRRGRPAAGAPARSRCGCRSARRCARTTCSATWPRPACRAWRSGATAHYRRTLRLPHGHGIVDAAADAGPHRLPADAHRPARPVDRDQPVPPDARPRRRPGRGRRPAADRPGARAAGRARTPGRRVPRTVDGAEFAIRAVLGQQVSTAAARTHAAPAGRRRTASRSRTRPAASPTCSPSPAALAGLDPATLAFPQSRRTTLADPGRRTRRPARSTSARAATGTRARAQLAALPGIGPWTVEIDRDAALGDPDAFLPTDLGIRFAAQRSRPAGSAPGPDRAVPRLAAVARVRRPVPVGHRRPRHQPAPRLRRQSDAYPHRRRQSRSARSRWSRRTARSAVCTWRCSGTGPPLDRFGLRDDDGLRRAGPAAGRVLRRRPHRVRPRAADGRHAVPAQGLGSAAGHPVRRDRVVRRARATHRRARQRPARSGWRTAGTRSASSCPATG